MACHMQSIGKERHGAIVETRDDLHDHEDGGHNDDDERPPFAPSRLVLTKQMVLVQGDMSRVCIFSNLPKPN